MSISSVGDVIVELTYSQYSELLEKTQSALAVAIIALLLVLAILFCSLVFDVFVKKDK